MKSIELKFGESLKIGDDIKITLLKDSKGQQYNFGVDAPREIPVHREEVYKQIQDEKNNT
jgi:carbon storage regulator